MASRPDSTRNLPNGYLKAGDVYLVVKSITYLTGACAFQKKFNCLHQVILGLVDGITLAGDVQLRAQGDISVAFSFDDCRKLMCGLHIAFFAS